MNLGVGLLVESVQWRECLRQEGVPYVLVDLSDSTTLSNIAVLVVNRNLRDNERRVVEEYLSGGGSILGFSHHLQSVAGAQHRRERIEYIVGSHDAIFPDVHLLDIGRDCMVACEANCMKTQAGVYAVFAGSMHGGHAVILPFDLEEVLGDHRAASKNFYATVDRLPSERVSLVGKGEVRHLVRRALEFLHHVRGLPYIHLWYYPSGKKNLFAFRIDSDGAPQRDVDELYALARSHNIPMTWFLDVKSHESWLQHFRYMSGQEFGVHCYEHHTYPTYEANLRNIQRAKHGMEAVGLIPGGFAAPFGIWNLELAKAAREIGFAYTSEFSFAYDTLPMYAATDSQQYALQVPIHPICIGSMRKVGYTEKRMKEYHRVTIARKLARHEPLFFYHHPTHRHWDVVNDLFEQMQENNVECTTLGEFAGWWKQREQIKLAADLQEGSLNIGFARLNERCWIRITTPGNKEAMCPPAERIDLSRLVWRQQASREPVPEDIHRIREFDPRAMVGELYNRLSRRLR